MTNSEKAKNIVGISSEAVRDKTGKGWDEWLEFLDEAGGEEMTHKQIVAIIAESFDIPDWWVQTVTVGYEQARGRQIVASTRTRSLPPQTRVVSPVQDQGICSELT